MANFLFITVYFWGVWFNDLLFWGGGSFSSLVSLYVKSLYVRCTVEYHKYQAVSKMSFILQFQNAFSFTLGISCENNNSHTICNYLLIINNLIIIILLGKPKKRKQPSRPDVMSYLSEKELEKELRSQELEYKRDALEAETKLRQEQLEVEKRRISLQQSGAMCNPVGIS